MDGDEWKRAHLELDVTWRALWCLGFVDEGQFALKSSVRSKFLGGMEGSVWVLGQGYY